MMAIDGLNRGNAAHVYFVNSMGTSVHRARQYSEQISRFFHDYQLLSSVGGVTAPMDFSIVKNVPQQTNSNDCGMCTCLNLAETSQNPAGLLSGSTQFSYEFDSDEVFSKRARKLLCLQIVDGRIDSEDLPLAGLAAGSYF